MHLNRRHSNHMKSRLMPLHVTAIMGLMLLCFQAGCNTSEVADADDDGHHLEHFIPHHKPPNFAAAVDDIESRVEHLSDHAGHGHAHEAEEFQELLDIVGWIPELAADSDLNESDWNQAKSSAAVMAKNLAARRSANGRLNLKALSKVIATELHILQSLITAAGIPEPAIHPGHNHGHHHGHEH